MCVFIGLNGIIHTALDKKKKKTTTKNNVSIFLICSRKHNVMGTHTQCLTQEFFMTIHNICFCGEIKNIYLNYPIPLLSRAIISDLFTILYLCVPGLAWTI